MSTKLAVFVISVLAVIFVVSQSIYTIKEFETGIKLQFGEVVETDLQPGLGFKAPVIHKIMRFETRNQVFDLDSQDSIAQYEGAPVRIEVDSYVIWRIQDVKRYYTNTSGSKSRALSLMGSRIHSGLLDKFGGLNLPEIVSGKRDALTQELTTRISEQTEKELGIKVLDIKLKKVELPIEVSESVYANMRAERERKAREERAIGIKKAEAIRAFADRKVTVILAEGYKLAEEIRGEGDAQSAAIYASAYGRDKEFYHFTRSLKAYQTAFSDKQDILLLTPDNDFFQYLNASKAGRSSVN